MAEKAVEMKKKEVEEMVEAIVGAKMEDYAPELQKQISEGMKDEVTKLMQSHGSVPTGSTERQHKFHPENKDHPYIQKNWSRVQNDVVPAAGRSGQFVPSRGAGLCFARLVRAYGVSQINRKLSVRDVLKEWGDDWMVRDLDEAAEKSPKFGSVKKAQGADLFTTGGALVPEDYMETFVGALRPQVVARAAGAVEVDLPEGNATITRQTGTSTLNYEAEGAAVDATGITFDQIRLQARTLRGLIPISNSLLDSASANADVIVRDDLTMTLAERQDLAFLRGDGTANSPTGMRNLFNPTHFVSTAGSTPTQIVTDLKGPLKTLAQANVRSNRLAWFFSPRSRIEIQLTREAGDGFFFREEMAGGTLVGARWFETTAQPVDLGVGSDESEFFVCAMDRFWIGDQVIARLEFFEHGTYPDGGQLRSALAQDESIIRITARHDCDVTHPEVGAGVTGVLY